MRILHLFPGADTSGGGMSAKLAHEALGDEVRLFVASPHPFGYPRGERWNWDAIDEAYGWADVVEIHNNAVIYPRIDKGRRKPVVIHHHGSRFRRDPETVYAEGEAIGAVQVVSTVDLLTVINKPLLWRPQITPVAALEAAKVAGRRRTRDTLICHAPSDRTVKGTKHVIRAVRELGKGVALDIVERTTWEQCLRRKAAADIYVDQFDLGYGMNAVEAWYLGLPVLAGATPEILARMRREYGVRSNRTLPFLLTTTDTLTERLRELIDSPALREKWASRGREHAERFHSPEAAVARIRAIYEQVPPSVGAQAPAVRPHVTRAAQTPRHITRGTPAIGPMTPMFGSRHVPLRIRRQQRREEAMA